jgi:hypothetical protein
MAMAKKRRVKCPYCEELSEDWTTPSGETATTIYHWLDCALANCGHDPRSRVKDCPLDMIGINHRGLLFSRPATTADRDKSTREAQRIPDKLTGYRR